MGDPDHKQYNIQMKYDTRNPILGFMYLQWNLYIFNLGYVALTGSCQHLAAVHNQLKKPLETNVNSR